MCEQCSAKTHSWGWVLPGYALVRATCDGTFMRTGQWGLVECNDPTFIWSVTPVPDLFYQFTDQEVDNLADREYDRHIDWLTQLDKFDWELGSTSSSAYKYHPSLLSSWQLVEVVRTTFNCKAHEVTEVLFHYLGRVLEDNPQPLYPHQD